MKKIKAVSVLCLLSGLLGGCQNMFDKRPMEYFSTHVNDYLESETIASLRIPADLSYETVQTYTLPVHLQPVGTLVPPSIVPPGFGELT